MTMFKGLGVALVTPFTSSLEIDFEGLGRVLNHVTKGGVDYLVVNGTTGESPTITSKEKWSILEYIFERTSLPIMLGYGGNCTQELIDEMDGLSQFPIKAILSVAPYYNKPFQKGLQLHYEAIADKSPVPVLLYNVPFRTSVNIEAETTLKLAKHPNIIGVKEASGDMNQITKIIDNRPENFLVLSGDDGMTLPILKAGGEGVISVIANYKPSEFTAMVNAALAGNFDQAAKQDEQLKSDYQLLSKEGNPTSVKTALEAIGLIERHVRLPLVPGSEELLQSFKK